MVLFQNIVEWPNIEDAIDIRWTKVILAAAHLDHDLPNNRTRYLKGLCQRCHMIHYRPHHLARRRITYLLRRAIGDLFLGPYKPIYWNEAGRAPNLLDQVI